MNLITDFYREDRDYRTKVEEVTLFGPSKLEENAKKQIMRDTANSRIKELKALNTTRPSSGKRFLRAATQTILGPNSKALQSNNQHGKHQSRKRRTQY